MTGWGKSFLGITLVGALVGVYLTARTVLTRNSWTEAIETLQTGNAKLADDVRRKEQELRDAKSKRSLLLTSWRRMFDDKKIAGGDIGYFDVSFNGTTTNVIGIRAPVTVREGIALPRFPVDANPQGNAGEVKPIFHAFRLTGDPQNPSQYVGPFRLLQERDDKSEFYLAWPTMEQTEAAVQAGAGQTWRFWEEVPRHYADEQRLQVMSLLAANEHKAKMGERLRDAQARQKESEKQREERIAEINQGIPNADSKELPPEDVEGLANAIVSAETERNKTLAEVDDLRRRIHDAQVLLNQLIDENRELERKLPHPAQTAGEPNGRPTVLK